jgi:flagellin
VDAIASITAAIETVSAQRAEYGAIQNRLQYTISNLMSVNASTVAARSRIEDADFAAESAVLAKAQVLQQSGAAMLAEANARPQLVLQLIK